MRFVIPLVAAVVMAANALIGALPTPPETPPTVSDEVRLAASAAQPAQPPPGALVGAFLRNQVENCSVICPFIVQGVTSIPVAVAAAPLVFANALTRQPLLQAIGTAAASVTQPLSDAAEGIINNDLNLVLPRAQRALEVAVVEAFNIGSTALTRTGQLLSAVAGARIRLLTALNQPLGTPTLPTGARTPLQIAAVRAIEIGSAITFQAPELLLLGAVRVLNTAATTLSRTGSISATISATGASIASTLTDAATAIRNAVTTPVTAAPATTSIIRSTPVASVTPKASRTATQGVVRNSTTARQGPNNGNVSQNTKPHKRFGHLTGTASGPGKRQH